MNKFITYMFLLIILSSGLAFGLVLVSNFRASADRKRRMDDEMGMIARRYNLVDDQRTTHAILTVERQETRMNPETLQNEAATTTLLLGLTDQDFNSPSYVQRIVIAGNIVKVEGIKLSFTPALLDDQTLLAGHTFYLFNTVSGAAGDLEPFTLNPVGFPPMALRHALPDCTEFEKQLWRPVWDMLMSGRPNPTVQREYLPAATHVMEVGKVYELFMGPLGVQIEMVEGDQRFSEMKWSMLRLARMQDTDTATGEKNAPAGRR